LQQESLCRQALHLLTDLHRRIVPLRAADAGSVSLGPGRYVLRDRDAIYGTHFAAMTHVMGIKEVLSAPRSPWQNPFADWLVGSIRRECLDHVIVWNERSLRRTLDSYFVYDQRSRTHLALGKDAPESRAVEPPEQGRVVAIPQVGGLHHRYQRRAD
jgi:putative transposase